MGSMIGRWFYISVISEIAYQSTRNRIMTN